MFAADCLTKKRSFKSNAKRKLKPDVLHARHLVRRHQHPQPQPEVHGEALALTIVLGRRLVKRPLQAVVSREATCRLISVAKPNKAVLVVGNLQDSRQRRDRGGPGLGSSSRHSLSSMSSIRGLVNSFLHRACCLWLIFRVVASGCCLHSANCTFNMESASFF